MVPIRCSWMYGAWCVGLMLLLTSCTVLEDAQSAAALPPSPPGQSPAEVRTATNAVPAGGEHPAWTENEQATLRSLWLGSLPPVPPDPSNAYADDPGAAALGQKFFFDTRFSANGQVACVTCHQPARLFTDGLPLARGIGTTNRNAMTIVGTAYSPWLFWDGRADSQWAQALIPLENPVEHGGTRTQYAHVIDEQYRAAYEIIFGPLPDLTDAARFPAEAGPLAADPAARTAWREMTPADRATVTRIFVNVGKAIAAYERLLVPGPARFDTYVEAVLANDVERMHATLTAEEAAGLRLFISPQVGCTRCHNGPLFTNESFHNTGVPTNPQNPADRGRATGVQHAQRDEFNCLTPYSDAGPEACAELRFAKTGGVELERAFKVPTLRNVTETAPYMHAGQFATLREVLHHYNRAPVAPSGHSELNRLYLTQAELDQLVAFLHTLESSVPVSSKWLEAPVPPANQYHETRCELR